MNGGGAIHGGKKKAVLAVNDKLLQTGRFKIRKVTLNTNVATIKSDSNTVKEQNNKQRRQP